MPEKLYRFFRLFRKTYPVWLKTCEVLQLQLIRTVFLTEHHTADRALQRLQSSAGYLLVSCPCPLKRYELTQGEITELRLMLLDYEAKMMDAVPYTDTDRLEKLATQLAGVTGPLRTFIQVPSPKKIYERI